MRHAYPLLWLLLAGLYLLNGSCATNRKKPDPKLAEGYEKIFKEHNPEKKTKINSIVFTTKITSQIELTEDKSQIWLNFAGEGAGALGVGLVAPPAVFVGGVILFPAGIYGYMYEKNVWNTINTALINYKFTNSIDDALSRRLNDNRIKEEFKNSFADIVIRHFGFRKKYSHDRHYCIILYTDFIIVRDDRKLIEENLNISIGNYVAPPQCNSIDYFAENNARLVKDTLLEYAEIIAIMVRDIIEGK